MYRKLLSRHCYIAYASIFPFYSQKRDCYDELESYQRPAANTGWDRVKLLFHIDEKGQVSKEYITLIHHAIGAMGISFFLGGLYASKQANDQYVRENQTTKYISVFEARRKLSDYVALQFVNGGIRYGLKIGFFIFLFNFASMVTAAYRGERGILEYAIGGAVAGSIVRSYLGIKACLSGGIIGTTMGGLLGTIIFLAVKISGTSLEEVEQRHYDLKNLRDERKAEVNKKLFEMTMDGRWEIYERLQNDVGYSLSDEDFAYIKVGDEKLNDMKNKQKIAKLIAARSSSKDESTNTSLELESKEISKTDKT